MSFEISEPVLIIGLGGVGSKLASNANKIMNYGFLQVVRDQKDVQGDGISIKISTNPVVNPSIPLIRGKTNEIEERLLDEISGYSTIILVANLAGKDGAAMAPVISGICKQNNKNLISLAIMPFRFEKERIFSSGLALKRVQADSKCTIVLDNDSLLESNPDLTQKQCYEIGNSAILYIMESIKNNIIPSEANLISTSNQNNYEEALRDSLKMLYNTTPAGSVKRSMLYVMGGQNVPVGVLNAISNITRSVFGEETKQVDMTMSASNESKIVMLTSVQSLSKFEKYDPLGIIPTSNTLDWDTPETSMGLNLDIPQLE